MKPCLMLRFDAPLMSFGGVAIDKNGPTEMHPGASMITGLLANALGWRHREHARHEALQARLRVASRWDRAPEIVLDYQTADLGQEHLMGTGWTTRGKPEGRGGGKDAAEGTTIRYRQYLANGCATVAVALEGPGEVSLDDLAHALQRPARPLVLGRRNCLPAAPILLGIRQAESLYDALLQEPVAVPRRRSLEDDVEVLRLRAAWPAEEGPCAASMRQEEVADLRQWKTAVHMGTRSYTFGTLEVKA